MELLTLMEQRRSIRLFTSDPISDENLDLILKAGMLGPSAKGRAPYSFIVVKDPEMIKKLISCRQGGAKMLETATCAIAILGDTTLSDTCVEDCSVCITYMHLMASSLGVGSVWLQNRLRPSDEEGTTSEDYVRSLLGFPKEQMLEATLVLGMPAQNPAPRDASAVPMEKVHYEKW